MQAKIDWIGLASTCVFTIPAHAPLTVFAKLALTSTSTIHVCTLYNYICMGLVSVHIMQIIYVTGIDLLSGAKVIKVYRSELLCVMLQYILSSEKSSRVSAFGSYIRINFFILATISGIRPVGVSCRQIARSNNETWRILICLY